MGVIAGGGVRIVNESVIKQLGLSEKEIAAAAAQEQVVLERRERTYRGDRRSPDIRGKTVIVVDDGMATGSTMQAAVLALKQSEPSETVVAVPVAAEAACEVLKKAVDRVVCLETPAPFGGVGRWYDDFSQTTDDEVIGFMNRAKEKG